jgi:nucleoside-diphosphate-sugar epimerase
MSQVVLPQERLVILGCGDIGLRLVRALPVNQYRTTGVRRKIQTEVLSNFVYHQADLSQSSSVHDLLEQVQPDVIVITMTPSERSDQAYQQAYVQTCDDLLQALRLLNQKPRLILFVSSTAVYAQDDGSWVDETSHTEPNSFSGKRLLEAENRLRDSEFTVCIIRFSGIYGPGRERLINQVKSGKISSSSAYTNRIHADDCAKVLAHLIEKHKTSSLDDLYLATDSCPETLHQVHLWLAAQLQIKNWVLSDETNERGNKKVSNARLLNTGFEFLYPGYQQGYAVLLSENT